MHEQPVAHPSEAATSAATQMTQAPTAWRRTMKPILILLAILFVFGTTWAQTPTPQKEKLQTSAAPQTPPGPVTSPEVLADHRVTFRLRAANAKEVSVQIDGASKPLVMQKDAAGIWSATTDPLAPDYYGVLRRWCGHV